MRKHYYRDLYGSTASIRTYRNGETTLTIRTYTGARVLRRTYATVRGAHIAMGQYSDTWVEQVA